MNENERREKNINDPIYSELATTFSHLPVHINILQFKHIDFFQV